MDKVKTSRLIVLIVMLGLLTGYTYMLRYRHIEEPDNPVLDLIPGKALAYNAIEEYIEPESLRLLGADVTIARSYIGESGRNIELFLGYFARQQENSQIHSPKHCYPGSGWDIIDEGTINIRFGKNTRKVKQLVISDGQVRKLVVYWFSMKGRVIPNEFALKYQQMRSGLLSKPQAAAFIRFSMVIAGNSDEDRMMMTEFIEAITPGIMSVLDGGATAP